MTMRGFAFRGIAAVLTACELCVPCAGAVTYEAPDNIELSIGDVEIPKEGLSGDTLVEVPLYIGSNPGFTSLSIVVALEGPLRYDDDHDVDTNVLAGVNIYRCNNTENIVSACFEAGSDTYYDDGKFGWLRVIVPADISAGRYGISFLTECDMYSLGIYTHNRKEARFGAASFSVLGGGSITVTEPQTEPPAGDQPAEKAGQPVMEAGGTAEAAAEAVVEAPAASAAATSVTAAGSAVTSTSGTSATTAVTTENVTTSTERTWIRSNEDNRSRNMLVPIIAATILALGAAAAFIAKKGGRSR